MRRCEQPTKTAHISFGSALGGVLVRFVVSRARVRNAFAWGTFVASALFVSGCGGDAETAGSGGSPNSGHAGSTGCADELRFATGVRAHEFGPGQDHGQDEFPTRLLGGPRGGGEGQGSLDVVSLGDGGFVELVFEAEIVDGPGTDFLVFENPFVVSGNVDDPFEELGVVAVSEDGEEWHEFPCTATEFPYEACAGWHPVVSNVETGAGDPFDPEFGGDPFDLEDLGLERARFVRVRDRPGDDVAFDLDAVALVHAECDEAR